MYQILFFNNIWDLYRLDLFYITLVLRLVNKPNLQPKIIRIVLKYSCYITLLVRGENNAGLALNEKLIYKYPCYTCDE